MRPLSARPVHKAPDEIGAVSEMLIGVPSCWFEPLSPGSNQGRGIGRQSYRGRILFEPSLGWQAGWATV
ncbi:hypothetical protein MesoLj113b_09870 [Mesorhizobium sp. 113-3-3]|nr:hypothetical protein MesoLj113b_09870 [Mesorhizobium sp. 113-3-3]